MLKKLFIWIPFVVLLGLIALFWKGLSLDTDKVPSPFIGKSAPALILPDLLSSDSTVDLSQWRGQVVLLNVWATWCSGCLLEHPVLNAMAAERLVPIIGLNYKDDPVKAKAWLQEQGNPYVAIPNDANGNVAIDWGVYGAPETFVIDKQGVIRYKHIAPISLQEWQNTLRPLVLALQQEQIP
ncbi:MAG: DsbE family thiol:disulfide interchange protein [Gammaproteobacteria bacterium]|nr:DsbE family thiol:disulfide interchange protein [Gammaproteobacteria bacterium]NNC98107.1 DsbE family thiol:disulfide interchange protein [Gammaproteobacteria bacterium]NNM13171.1 DsbE family thiol:disulfide interchange protein [Gammaproteobacteria bacterium]